MEDDSIIYNRWSELLKVIATFQCYVQRKHLDSGVMSVFPRVIIHPAVKGKVGAEKKQDVHGGVCDFHVYAYGTITDVAGYINLYVDYLTSDLIRRGGPILEIEPFAVNMSWRTYIDGIFERIKKAVKDENR